VSAAYGTQVFKTTGTDFPGSLECTSATAVSGATITVTVKDNNFTLLTPIATALVGPLQLTATDTVQELG
jgi:hypothetical protein